MNIYSTLRELLYYMREMNTEEVSMKTGKWELTARLTEAEENVKIESGQECAKSIPPEVGAQAGDGIIPALLNILPYDTIVEWKTNTGEWHTNMIHDISRKMIDSFPEKLRIIYKPDESLLVIGGC